MSWSGFTRGKSAPLNVSSSPIGKSPAGSVFGSRVARGRRCGLSVGLGRRNGLPSIAGVFLGRCKSAGELVNLCCQLGNAQGCRDRLCGQIECQLPTHGVRASVALISYLPSLPMSADAGDGSRVWPLRRCHCRTARRGVLLLKSASVCCPRLSPAGPLLLRPPVTCYD